MKSDFQMVDYSVLKFVYDIENPHVEMSSYNFQLKNKIHIQEDERKGSITSLVTAVGSSDIDDESTVKIQLLFAALFRAASETDANNFSKMLSLNGMATIIPIIRSTLLTASSVLGIKGKVILPNIDVTKLEWNNDIVLDTIPKENVEEVNP